MKNLEDKGLKWNPSSNW